MSRSVKENEHRYHEGENMITPEELEIGVIGLTIICLMFDMRTKIEKVVRVCETLGKRAKREYKKGNISEFKRLMRRSLSCTERVQRLALAPLRKYRVLTLNGGE